MNRIAFASHTFLLLIFLSGISSNEDDDFEAMMNVDTTYWVDPYDMVGYVPNIKTMQDIKEPVKRKILKEERIGEKDSLKEEKSVAVEIAQEFQNDELGYQKYSSAYWKNCVDETPIVSRLVRMLIRQLGLESMEIKSEEETRYISLVAKVTRNDLKLLEKFSASHDGNIHDISDAVIQIFSTSELQEECSWKNIALYLNKFEIWVMLCMISLLFLLWMMIRQVYLWKLLTIVMLLLFFLSVLWHWIHMYKVALARKQAEVLQYTTIPVECNPNEMPWYDSFLKWFIGGDDKCIRYFEALMVDPFWEVTPTRAVAETFTRFFLHPFEQVGTAVGQFFNKILANVPAMWHLPVLVIVSSIMIIIIIMMCDYRLVAPFCLGRLEPGRKTDGTQTLKKLSYDISTVKDEVQKLQHNINTVRDQSSQPSLCYYRSQLSDKIQELNPDDLQKPQGSHQGVREEGPGGDPVGHSRREGSHKSSSRISSLHGGTCPSQGLKCVGHRAQDSNFQKEATISTGFRTVGGDSDEEMDHVEEEKSQLHKDNKELQNTSQKEENIKVRSKLDEGIKKLYAGRHCKNVASENIMDTNTPSASKITRNKIPKTQKSYFPLEQSLLSEKDEHKVHQNHKSSSSVLNSIDKSIGMSCDSDDSELIFEAPMRPASSEATAHLPHIRSLEECESKEYDLSHPGSPEEEICTSKNFSDSTNNDKPFLERIVLVLKEKKRHENDT